MFLKQLFRIVSLCMIIASATVMLSSLTAVNDLTFPVKVDSAYVKSRLMLEVTSGNELIPGWYEGKIYRPEQLEWDYEPMNVLVDEEITLRGWYFKNKEVRAKSTLLIIHDLHRSKISYLRSAKQFAERGFDVCMVDMRAHGESDGKVFSLGEESTSDFIAIVDHIRAMEPDKHLVVMGFGMGSVIAMRALSTEKRPVAIISQDPILSMDKYLNEYALNKYGKFSPFIYPILKRELERKMSFKVDELNMVDFVRKVEVPSLFIASVDESNKEFEESRILYQSSPAERKRLWIVSKSVQSNSEVLFHKDYFDKIAVFINLAIPRQAHRTSGNKGLV